MADRGDLQELEEAFSQIALDLFSEGTVEATLARIVDLAVVAIEGCDTAGIMVVEDGAASTISGGSSLAVALDQLQVASDEGPCLDAATSGAILYAEDLADDPRWPTFGPAAVSAGARSVLAHPLSVSGGSGVLNLYSGHPSAFGVTERAKGHLFATLAGLALGSAEERAAGEAHAVNLGEALQTRELIGQAQGILMERERLSADQAFDVLRRASQHVNRKLRTIAAALVETGETPSTGSPIERPE